MTAFIRQSVVCMLIALVSATAAGCATPNGNAGKNGRAAKDGSASAVTHRGTLGDEPEDAPRWMYQLALMDQIQRIVGENDLPAARRFADNLGARWPNYDVEVYGHLAVDLVSGLANATDKRTQEHLRIAKRVADRALKFEKQMPVEPLADLAHWVFWVEMYLLPEDPRVPWPAETSETWRRQRTEIVERWVRVKNRFDAAMDPNWNPDPTSMEQQFNDDLSNFHEVRSAWSRESIFRDTRDSFLSSLEFAFESAYVHGPPDLAEARRHAAQLFDDPAVRREVLAAIEKGTN